MDAIATHGLTKQYGRQTALRGLDLRVATGRLFGFLGPNGAGKTTCIRLLLGLLRATAGRASVLGLDAWNDGPRLRAAVGYLPGDVRFWDGLTGRTTLRFLNRARGGEHWPEVQRLAERLDLVLDKRVRDYSRGMKQKLGIIAALMHKPRLLILDEPTTALDPLVRAALYDELRAVASAGRTVLFSSHTLAEVETLCDEVAVVRRGRLIEQEKMSVLRERALRHIEVHWRRDAAPPRTGPRGLHVLENAGGYLRATWTGEVSTLLTWLAPLPVQDVTIAPPDLDDLFLEYYRETGEEAAA
jgi:ABC-2 type transport system ATP-binding protein